MHKHEDPGAYSRDPQPARPPNRSPDKWPQLPPIVTGLFDVLRYVGRLTSPHRATPEHARSRAHPDGLRIQLAACIRCSASISILDIGDPMGTNVHLTPELERFAQGCVASGRFNNVSEVVRSGLRLLQDAEERRAAFVASLEVAVAEGDLDGFLTAEDVETDVQAAIDAVRAR